MTRSLLLWVFAATALSACFDSSGTRETGSGGASGSTSSASTSHSTSSATTSSTGTGMMAPPSCQAILTADPQSQSGIYMLADEKGTNYQVYCEMVADGGGWTLALKIDGAQTVLEYDDALWTDANTLNDGSPSLSDLVSAKLLSYVAIPVGELRLGMIAQGKTSWAVSPLSTTGMTLQALVASGVKTSTSLGVWGWQGLIAGSTLDSGGCQSEGVDPPDNPTSPTKARIGMLTGGGGGCGHPYRGIGYGMKGLMSQLSAGYFDDGGQSNAAFGFVMVR